MRLIDADAFIGSLEEYINKPITAGLVATLVELQPTAYNEVKTNADYIRNMTDEELAEFILSITEDGVYNTIIDDYCFNDSKEILNWLKAEREG